MIISCGDLVNLRDKNKDKKIVFCTGVFDLTHAGHVLFFENCKRYGDILVVGVGNDVLVKQQKKDRRPILNEKLRTKMVDSLKTVDYVFLFENKEWKGKDTHKEMLEPIFKILKPDFYIVNEDVGDIEERELLSGKNNVKMIVLKRSCPEEFESVSTTGIIRKIRNT